MSAGAPRRRRALLTADMDTVALRAYLVAEAEEVGTVAVPAVQVLQEVPEHQQVVVQDIYIHPEFLQEQL